MQHIHERPSGCHCDVAGLEPCEDCPVHGVPENRCQICGQFMKSEPHESWPAFEATWIEISKVRRAIRRWQVNYDHRTSAMGKKHMNEYNRFDLNALRDFTRENGVSVMINYWEAANELEVETHSAAEAERFSHEAE